MIPVTPTPKSPERASAKLRAAATTISELSYHDMTTLVRLCIANDSVRASIASQLSSGSLEILKMPCDVCRPETPLGLPVFAPGVRTINHTLEIRHDEDDFSGGFKQ